MTQLTITRKATGKIPTINDVKTFETKNGIKLPNDLIQFLIDPNMQPKTTVENKISINGYVYEMWNWSSWDEIRKKSVIMFDVFGIEYLSFGYTSSNIFWVGSLKEGDYGKVYMYNAEEDDESEIKLLAAASFSDFINALFE